MPRKNGRKNGTKKGKHKRNSNRKGKRTQVIHKSNQSKSQQTSFCGEARKTTSYTHCHYIKLPNDLENAFLAQKHKLENESKLEELETGRQESVNEHTSQCAKINEQFTKLQNQYQRCDANEIAQASKKLTQLKEKLKHQAKQTKLFQIMVEEWKSICDTHFNHLKHNEKIKLNIFQQIANCLNKLNGINCDFNNSRGKGGHALFTINKKVITIHKAMKVGHFKDSLNHILSKILLNQNNTDLKRHCVKPTPVSKKHNKNTKNAKKKNHNNDTKNNNTKSNKTKNDTNNNAECKSMDAELQVKQLENQIASIKEKYETNKNDLNSKQNDIDQQLEIRLAIYQTEELKLIDQVEKCQTEFQAAVHNHIQAQKEILNHYTKMFNSTTKRFVQQAPFWQYFKKRDSLFQDIINFENNNTKHELSEMDMESYTNEQELLQQELLDVLIQGTKLYPKYKQIFHDHPRRMNEKQFVFSMFRTVYDRDIMLTFQQNDATIFYFKVWFDPKIFCPMRDVWDKHKLTIRKIVNRVLLEREGTADLIMIEYYIAQLFQMFIDSLNSILFVFQLVGLPATHHNLRGLKMAVQMYKKTLKRVIGYPEHPKKKHNAADDPNRTDIVAFLEAIRQVLPNYFNTMFPSELPQLQAEQAVNEHIARETYLKQNGQWNELEPHMQMPYSTLYHCYYQLLFSCCPELMRCIGTAEYQYNLNKYLNEGIHRDLNLQVQKLKKFVVKHKNELERFAQPFV